MSRLPSGRRRAAPGCRRWRRLLLAAALPALWACGPDGLGGDAPGACTEVGAQCPLPEGPLGVCERAPCPAGAAPPCFACVPQH